MRNAISKGKSPIVVHVLYWFRYYFGDYYESVILFDDVTFDWRADDGLTHVNMRKNRPAGDLYWENVEHQEVHGRPGYLRLII